MKNLNLFLSIAGSSLCGSSIFFAIFNLIQDIDMPAAGFLIAGIACLTIANSIDLAHFKLWREVDEVFQKETNRRLKELSGSQLKNPDCMARVSPEFMQEDPHEYGQVLHQQGETMAQQETMPEWNDLIKTVKHAWQYGVHCNDMTLGEIESDVSCALDRFAKANGLPEINWEEEEENDA